MPSRRPLIVCASVLRCTPVGVFTSDGRMVGILISGATDFVYRVGDYSDESIPCREYSRCEAGVNTPDSCRRYDTSVALPESCGTSADSNGANWFECATACRDSEGMEIHACSGENVASVAAVIASLRVHVPSDRSCSYRVVATAIDPSDTAAGCGLSTPPPPPSPPPPPPSLPRTCADTNADGAADDPFDCSSSANDVDTDAGNIQCELDACTETACCTTVPPTPDVNCVGEWSQCGRACTKVFRVAVAASGAGSACPVGNGVTQHCSAGEGSCQTPPPPPNSVIASLALDKDIEEIPEGSLARMEFERSFKEDVADIVSVKTERIVITAIEMGSIVVDFLVLPDGSSPFSAADLEAVFSVAGVSIAGASTTAPVASPPLKKSLYLSNHFCTCSRKRLIRRRRYTG